MQSKIIDYVLAIAIGLCLAMAALAYFDVLTK
jgi:hypothetical protein